MPPGSGTRAFTVHGAAGVVDLVVPDRATVLDVARSYAEMTGSSSIPVLHTRLGEPVPAGASLRSVGLHSGDLLVASAGVLRPRAGRPAPAPEPARRRSWVSTALVTAVSAGQVAAWAASAGPEWLRWVVATLMVLAAVGCLLPGRAAHGRLLCTPAFSVAALTVWQAPGSGAEVPVFLALAGLTVLATSGVVWLLRGPEVGLQVWAGAGACHLLFGFVVHVLQWPVAVLWSVLVAGVVLAARGMPRWAVEVTDEELLDPRAGELPTRRPVRVDRARELVRTAHVVLVASCLALLVTVAVAVPALLVTTPDVVDRTGARVLIGTAGVALLLAARGHRVRAARNLVRITGALALVVLVVDLVIGGWGLGDDARLVAVVALAVLGLVCTAFGVALGRGWSTSAWAVAGDRSEVLLGALAVAAAVVSSGLFRWVWERPG